MHRAFAAQSRRPEDGLRSACAQTYNDADRRFTLKTKRKRGPAAPNRDTGS